MRTTWSDLGAARAAIVVTIGVLVQTAPAWVVTSGALVAGVVVEAATGDNGLRVIGQIALAYAAIALVGASVLHEVAHVAASAWGVDRPRFDVQIRLLRCSLVPLHAISRRRAILGAVAGPGACVVVGVALAAGSSHVVWVVPFLAHALSLLPAFGDGRSILAALRTS